MSTTTTDFFEALQNLIPGSKVDPAAAKKITDYVEETKTTNVANMKEIFLTKDDKIELIGAMKQDKIEVVEKIHKSKTETIMWIVGVGIIQLILYSFLPS